MTASIPKVAADFETGLNAAVSEGDTTASLISIVDVDGNNLASGLYAFTVDNDTDYKEFIVCQLSGTSLSSISSISAQGAVTSGFANYHRRGASVEITDWAVLYRLVANLSGATGLDSASPLFYDGTATISSANMLATKAYVDAIVNGGAVTFDQQVVPGQTAGENLTAEDSVYYKEADDAWFKTDADTLATIQDVVQGIALATTSMGNTLQIAISGPVQMTSITEGERYYASSTPGALVTPAPSAPAYTRLVGIGLPSNKLLLCPPSTLAQFSGTAGQPSASNKFITQENLYNATYDQAQTTRNGGQAFGEADATTRKNRLAQSFVAGRIKIKGIELYKDADTGSFTGTVTVALQADSAGAPSGSNLASATITNANWLALAAGAFQVGFTEYSMTIGTTYWIVVSASSADNSNHPNLGVNTAGGYANGILRYNNTTDGWVTISGQDAYFRTINGTNSQVPAATSGGVVPSGILPYSLFDIDRSTTASNTSETTVYSKSLPAGFFTENTGLRLTGVFNSETSTSGSGNATTVRVKLNGNTVVTLDPGALDVSVGNVLCRWDSYILNQGSLSSQEYVASLLGVLNGIANAGSGNGGGFSKSVTGTSAIDTSGAVQLTVTMQNSVAWAANVSLVVERIG